MPQEMRSLESLINVSKNWNGNRFDSESKDDKKVLQQETFLEYVEKLAILDVLFEPFIQDHFVKHKSFPFTEKGFLGHETAVLNVFTFWNHYRNKYAKELAHLVVPADKMEEYQQEMGLRFDDDALSTEEDEEDIAEQLREDSPAGKG